MITIDFTDTMITKQKVFSYKEEIEKLDKKLEKLTKNNKDMAKWVYWPEEVPLDELDRMKKVSERVKKNSDVLLVIGIGGSYLGAKAVIELFKSNLNKDENETEVIFVGNNMSTKYINDVIEYIENKDFSINVISKSGTTLEPALSFRIFKNLLTQKYNPKEANERIIVTTDEESGVLRTISLGEKYETFFIPSGIGGRYSVLTPVGLFPLLVANIDVDKILDGAKKSVDEFSSENIEENIAYQYATVRHILANDEKDIELFVSYEPSFTYFIEWLKQLFNESEGKDSKGLFTTGTINTTDLHSIGQNIQDGKRNIFETVLWVDDMNTEDITISEVEGDIDKLNYLDKKTLNEINKIAMIATKEAHKNDKVPNISITLDKLTEENVGKLLYFFEKACAIYCMLEKVNPFDQPGVEKYKQIMFKLLKEKK